MSSSLLSITIHGIVLCGPLVVPITATAQVVSYDNLDNVRFDDDWQTALGSDRRYAQQFLLGDSTNIDQVTLKLQRPRSGVTGSLHFELWRDNGSGKPAPVDDPTGKIADLGAVADVTQVPVGSFGTFTFDNLVLGLEPNSSYWVVTDFADVNGIQSGEVSIGFAAVGDPHPTPAPAGFDVTAGTNGAAHLHAYRNQDPFWADLNNVFGMNHFYQAMKVEAMEDSDRTVSTIYDNAATELTSGDRILPSPLDTYVAQPFNLGPHNGIAATHINVSRTGSTSGSVRFSVWDSSEGGVPGQEIAELGTIDVSLLEDVGARPSVIPSVTFDTPIDGLTPEATYFVVSDVTGLNISGTEQSPNSIVFGGLKNNAGTNEADDWIATRPDRRPPLEEQDWTSFSSFGLGRRWMQLAIEATSSIGDGDLNENGILDAIDIDMLSSAVRQNLVDPVYDLDQDGDLTADDRAAWVHDSADTYFGDSNLDGQFTSSDLTLVFATSEYEDNITLNSSWSEGDWNGDGDFDSDDLITAFNDGGYEKGPHLSLAAVPEPSAVALFAIGGLGLVGRRPPRSDASRSNLPSRGLCKL